MAKYNNRRFFYVLYSDKTRIFDQSERAYYPICITNINMYIYKICPFNSRSKETALFMLKNKQKNRNKQEKET